MLSKKLLLNSVLALMVFPAASALAQKPAATPLVNTTTDAVPEDIDSLVAKDSYIGYAEVRMVGRQVQSRQISEIFEALEMLDALPPDVARVRDFLVSHSDELDDSRAVIAFYPARPGLPETLVAIEMESPEAAAKLEVQVGKMLMKLSLTEAEKTEAAKKLAAGGDKTPKSDASSPIERRLEAHNIFLRLSGKLICVANTRINFTALRPPDSKPMSADRLFETGRSRFASDPLFVFYNQKVHSVVAKQEAEEREAEFEKQRATAKTRGKVMAGPPPVRTGGDDDDDTRDTTGDVATAVTGTTADGQRINTEVRNGDDPPPPAAANVQPNEPPKPPSAEQVASRNAVSSMFSSLGALASKWPDAIGFGVSFEGDDIAVHAVLLGKGGDPSVPVPFLPYLITAEPISGKASSLAPATSDLFISASLDLSRMYDAAIAPAAKNPAASGAELQKTAAAKAPGEEGGDDSENSTAKKMAVLETLLGFRIKEDLIASFGKEVAVAIRSRPLVTTADDGSKTTNAKPNYVLLISVQNRDGAERMLPKLLTVFGMNAGGSGTSEHVGDIDITNYTSFSLAFIDDFVVIAGDNAGVKEVIDARARQTVLQTSKAFREATAWQPQERTGQIFLSEGFIGSATSMESTVFDYAGDTGKAFLTRFNAKARPVSFSISNDGTVLQHELHVPESTILNYIGEVTFVERYGRIIGNENSSKYMLTSISTAEKTYKDGQGQGKYGTLDDLKKAHLYGDVTSPGMNVAYKIELSTSGDGFEATATPVEYGSNAKHSFFIDQTGILHGGDLGGRRASASEPVINMNNMGIGLD